MQIKKAVALKLPAQRFACTLTVFRPLSLHIKFLKAFAAPLAYLQMQIKKAVAFKLPVPRFACTIAVCRPLSLNVSQIACTLAVCRPISLYAKFLEDFGDP